MHRTHCHTFYLELWIFFRIFKGRVGGVRAHYASKGNSLPLRRNYSLSRCIGKQTKTPLACNERRRERWSRSGKLPHQNEKSFPHWTNCHTNNLDI
jgi:hypothetical protein